jgi:DNA topoisomerase VI subunit A
MTPEEFVREFYLERKSHINLYFERENQTDVSSLIQSLNLNSEQEKVFKKILNASFRDLIYTILLGLDGAASIGTKQQLYRIHDEDGNELTGGDIETYAWEYFHNRKEDY